MEFCEEGHDSIVHDCRKCPMCQALEQIQDLENRIEELEEKNV